MSNSAAATVADPAKQIYEKIRQVRASKTLELTPTPMFRREIIGLDGLPQPFRLRYYQAQGIFHLLMVNRMVLGDGTGLGKTLQAIGALCYIWERDPEIKAIVVCPKSAIRQWAAEVEKFTTGIKTYVATGTIEERKAAYLAWARASNDPKAPRAILIVNYHGVIRDWDYGIKKEAPPPGSKPGTQAVAGRGFLDDLTSKMTSSVEAPGFVPTSAALSIAK